MAIQAKSGSPREKWVAAFIPTVGIILVGFFYFTFYLKPDIESVESKLETARSNSTTPAVLRQLNDELQELRGDKTELESTIDSIEDEIAAKSLGFGELSLTTKHRAVTALLLEFDIALLEDTASTQTDLSPLRDKSFEVLESMPRNRGLNFRNLTLTADYKTVVDLLKKLPEIEGVLPVNISLKKTNSFNATTVSSNRSPTLTVTLLM